MVKKNFFWKIFEFVPKLPKFWQVVDPDNLKKKKSKFFFSNTGILYIFGKAFTLLIFFSIGNLISNTMVKLLSV